MARNGVQQLDLNLLVTLHVLLEERNVTRTARRLHVGQPAMSATLKRLRILLNDDLLVRRGTSMAITPVAEDLIAPVADALQRIDAVLDRQERFDPATSQATFTVLANDYVALVLLQPLLQELNETAPFVRLQPQPLTHDFQDLLRTGKADIAVLPSELAIGTNGLRQQHLFTDSYVYLADPSNADAMTVDWDDLASLPQVGYYEHEVPPSALSADHGLPYAQHGDSTTESLLLSAYLVQGTRLVCAVPRKLALVARQNFGLVVLEPPEARMVFHETAYWSARTADEAAHQWLREKIRRVAGLSG